MPRVDARTRASRRYLELVQTFESDLDRKLTEVDRVMLKQAASLTMQAEDVEASVVKGLPVDPDLSIRLTSEVRRILATLKSNGSKRSESSAVDDLQSYLANQAGGAA